MGYIFISIGPAKKVESHVMPSWQEHRNVGAVITAGGKVDLEAILERKWLQIVKYSTLHVCLINPIPDYICFLKLYTSIRKQVLGCSSQHHFQSGKPKAIWGPTLRSEQGKCNRCIPGGLCNHKLNSRPWIDCSFNCTVDLSVQGGGGGE